MKTHHTITGYISLLALLFNSCASPNSADNRGRVGGGYSHASHATTADSVRLPDGTHFFFDKEGLKYAYLHKITVSASQVSGYVIRRDLEDIDYEDDSADSTSSSDEVCSFSGKVLTDNRIKVNFNGYPPYNLPNSEIGGKETVWAVTGSPGAWRLVVPASFRSQDGTNQYTDGERTAALTKLSPNYANNSGGGDLVVAAGLAIGMALVIWGGAKLLGAGRDFIADGASSGSYSPPSNSNSNSPASPYEDCVCTYDGMDPKHKILGQGEVNYLVLRTPTGRSFSVRYSGRLGSGEEPYSFEGSKINVKFSSTGAPISLKNASNGRTASVTSWNPK